MTDFIQIPHVGKIARSWNPHFNLVKFHGIEHVNMQVMITIVYSLTSSILSVMNKYLLDFYPYPGSVLTFQLLSTALLIYVFSFVGIKPLRQITVNVAIGFLPLVFSFFLLLSSSLLLLENSHFPVFIICKSLTPFFMSLSESLYFRAPCPGFQSLSALVGMIAGSFMYTKYDLTYNDSPCIVYSIMFIFASVLEGLVAKQTIRMFDDLDEVTRTFLMNSLSVPLAMVWSILRENGSASAMTNKSVFVLILSCVLGLVMGLTTMYMRATFSATYVSVVSVCNKFLSLFFASFVLQGSTTLRGTLSTVFVLVCGTLYTEQRPSDNEITHSIGLRARKFMPLVLALFFTLIFAVTDDIAWMTTKSSFMEKGIQGCDAVIEQSATSGTLFEGIKTRNFNKYNHTDMFSRDESVENNWRMLKLKSCVHWSVVTTIFEPTEAVKDACSRLRDIDGCLLVVGDAKGPSTYSIDNSQCTYAYVNFEDQTEFGGSFALALPSNHFSRKNLGYILAIQHGANTIWDFDDDNLLIRDDIKIVSQAAHANNSSLATLQLVVQTDVLNPYPLLGSTHFAWPRGFPLTEIKNGARTPRTFNLRLMNVSMRHIGVVQALANYDPDVDAIYRLQRKLPLHFLYDSLALLFPVPIVTMVPFNAQATLWASPDSFWGLYLPVSVHGRVADIWRSYIFQRLARDVCLQTAFSTSPWVEQRRNPHSYIADLNAEQDLYFKTEALLTFLHNWSPEGSDFSLPRNFVDLYTALYEREFVDMKDVRLSRMWIAELKSVGYFFPQRKALCAVTQSLSNSTLRNTTLIVRINHDHGSQIANRYLEIWSDALQKYGIHEIIFYGKALNIMDIQAPYGHLSVKVCESSHDSVGFFWYHVNCSVQGSIPDATAKTSNRGYIFAHDDAVLNLQSLSSYETESSWFTLGHSPAYGPDIFNQTEVNGYHWPWFKSPVGARTIIAALNDDEFAKMYNDSLWNCHPNQGLHLPYGQADVYFISTQNFKEYQKAAAMFAKFNIFLEIAVPTIAVCILPGFREINLWTRWDGDRGKPPPVDANFDIAHPLKLSNSEAYNFTFEFARKI